MIRLSALLVAVCVGVPVAAFAQDGNQGQTANPKRNAASAGKAGATLPGTAPMRMGRSVGKGQNINKSDIDVGPVEQTPRICTNCDD